MESLKELNPQQKEAVLHGDGPLLILAGAGSGKTKTLTYRIAHLIKKAGVRPSEVFSVTFTNKAAGEMRLRVEELIGTTTRGMWISTFHSACARILRDHIDLMGYGKNFNIIDAADSASLIKACMKDLNISDRLFSPRDISAKISALKSSIITPGEYTDTAQPFGFEAKAAKIYPVYQDRLKASGVLDFDDLLMLTVMLFKKHPEVLKQYHKLFRHILVDEYQDTNAAQYMLLKLLAGKNRNVCVVGDDDQSIYGWRGADIRNILEFEKDYPDAKVVKLEQNYRSTQRILDAAWSVVCNNTGRRDKKLWSDLGKGDKMEYLRLPDEAAEARHIATEVVTAARTGRPYSDFAVLYRTNTQSRTIEEAFRRENIPYIVYGGTKFYDRKEVKDLITYLKVISNPDDSVSLKRVVNTPPRGIGEAAMKKANELALPDNLPLVRCLEALAQDPVMAAGSRKRIQEFLDLLAKFKEAKDVVPPSKLAAMVLKEVAYVPYLRESLGIEAPGKVDNLKELLASIEEFESSGEGSTLEDYLAHITLVTDLDTKKQASAVTMMTLHLSKGLEFPVVFIAGLEEGLIPHAQSNCNMAELEEERRLLYVGMTRACRKLYLLNAMSRRLAGLTQSNKESRFIEEIPENLLSIKKTKFPRFEVPAPCPSPSVPVQRPVASGCYFKNGDRVRHQLWGMGVIEKTDGKGNEQKVIVQFSSVGRKKLLARMANLTRA